MAGEDKPTIRYERVLITGTLTLESFLALRDGNVELSESEDAGDVAQVAQIKERREVEGEWVEASRPVIPGASLKGALRSYLTRRGCDSDLVEKVFGKASSKRVIEGETVTAPGFGGRFEFRYAKATDVVELPVETHVAIDRATGAAAENLLFAGYVVPKGVRFDVEIDGFRISDAEVGALLAALDGFGSPKRVPKNGDEVRSPVAVPDRGERIRLGSKKSGDFGSASWEPKQILAFTAADVAKWLANRMSGDDIASCDDVWTALEGVAKAPQTFERPRLDHRGLLTFEFSLEFDGWFLVRDPHAKPSDDGPDAVPRVEAIDLEKGSARHVILPSASFRGAFRSQAERIARTIASDGDEVSAGSESAAEELLRALFGDTTSRSPIDCSTFVDERPAFDASGSFGETRQVSVDEALKLAGGATTLIFRREFVAIDRFTGAAADGLKFDVAAAWRPKLVGRLTVDLEALGSRCERLRRKSSPSGPAPTPVAAIGLLLLTLLDLADGDIAFGALTRRGFGACRVELFEVHVPDLEAFEKALAFDERTADVTEDELAASENLNKRFVGSDDFTILAILGVRELRTFLGVSSPVS